MKSTILAAIIVAIVPPFLTSCHAQEREPDLVISPDTIRIQSTDSPKEGNWVIGEKVGMVRLSLDAPGRPSELSTEYDEPHSPACFVGREADRLYRKEA